MPLDKSAFAPMFGAVASNVWQHSLTHLCLWWSEVKQQEALRAQLLSLQSLGDGMNLLTAATNQNNG